MTDLTLPAPETYRSSAEPQVWQQTAQDIARVFSDMDRDAARTPAIDGRSEADADKMRRDATDNVRKVIGSMQNNSWPHHRTYYTYGQIDTDALIVCCERRLLSWQDVFMAKAAHGTPEDVQRIATQADLFGNKVDLNRALNYGARPEVLTPGLKHEGNLQTAEELLRMGASPSYDNCTLFLNAAENGRTDIARAMAKYAHTVNNMNLETWANWAKGQNKPKLYQTLREIYWDYGRFLVTDPDTLVETKPLQDNANLRMIFNFASQRVSEVYEYSNPRQVIKNDYDFGDYAESALVAARAKLVELGGKPSTEDYSFTGRKNMAKPKLPTPASKS